MKSRFMKALIFALGLGACSAEPDAPYTEVPFDDHRDQVILTATINGQGPYNLLLDTGVDPAGIDLAVAEATGLPVDRGDENEAEGVGSDRVAIYPAMVEGMQLAGLDIASFPAAAMDLTQLGERLGKPLHGILGYAFLQGRMVEIDYPAGTVRLWHEEGYDRCGAGQADCFEVPLVPASGTDMIPLLRSVNVGGAYLDISLDTGSSGGLDLNPDTLDARDGDYAIEEGREVRVTGARGDDFRAVGEVPQVGFGPFELHDIEALFETRRFSTGSYRQGNMGNEVFQHFRIIFDYANSRIVFHCETDACRAA